ncbi:hypothetical protein [Streptomyces sp. NPDC057909]|uniref:hypothetical protein n=1 Tax=Streptomyces sp. NPDC057909 TaxID=3346277 RepID=UPI0036EA7B10
MNSPHTVEVNRLHAELDHLNTVHRTAARLARILTEHLADEPFRLAEQLARLLDGQLEPDEVTAEEAP